MNVTEKKRKNSKAEKEVQNMRKLIKTQAPKVLDIKLCDINMINALQPVVLNRGWAEEEVIEGIQTFSSISE